MGKPLLTLLFLVNSILVFGQKIEVNSILTYPFSIHAQAEILDMNRVDVELEQILANPNSYRFTKLENENTNLGFTDHHYWVRFTLSNESAVNKTFFLKTARPITDMADLYEVHAGQVVAITRNGDTYPFHSRKIAHRDLLYPISLPPNSSSLFYLHLKSDGEVINLPLAIHDSTSLVESTFQDQLVFGVFYGILLLAGITYLFFLFGIKEKSFLLYVAYVISIGLLHSSLDGYFYQYILKTPGWFADRSLLIFATVSAILLNRYNQVFIKVRSFSKGLDLAFIGINISLLVLLLGIVLIDEGRPFYYPLVNGLGFLGVIFIIISILMSYVKEKPVDPFFALGITSLTIGFITFILNNFSLIENSFITENASKLGTGLEIIFLSLSMANRIRNLRNEKEKAQNLALQRSEESNEIKSFFLSNMSHELRTPLNAILGLSQSIMAEISDEKIKENLEVIKYSSVSLLSSIDDILDYSKIEKGELNLERKPFDPQKTLTEIKALAYQKARDKGLLFSYEEEIELPKRLIGDSIRFGQIMNNILDNAIKFTPAGKVKLKVTGIQDEGEKQVITFLITDTGVGINPKKLERIFESFIQERIDDKRKFGGFGLGLCIVKSLTDLYGGSIAVESQLGQGTSIEVKLPFIKAQEETFDLIKKDSEALLTGKSILVVEDNPVNQLVLRSILRKWKGVTYDFAGHGLEALDKMNTQTFDLILMDLQMPEMDGYEATSAIRMGQAGAQHSNIPIIAVTADTTEKSKIQANNVGMDDYMTKPIDAELLREKVLKAFYLEKIELGPIQP